VRPLEPEERQQLEEFIELTNDARLQTRARKVWLFHKRQHTIQEIADILNTHEDSVRKWIDRFEKRGFDGLKDDPQPGAPHRAGAPYIAFLLERVRGTPRDYRLNTHTWTLELFAYHLFQQTGVAISSERVRQPLVAHDFVCRRPKTIVRSPDPHKRETMERIAEVLFSPGNYVVLFEDETDLNMNPGIQRCWMPRGEQREIVTPGRNKKIHVFGVVDARKSEVRVRIARKKNTRTFVAFIRQILRAYPGRRIYVAIDNLGDARCEGRARVSRAPPPHRVRALAELFAAAQCHRAAVASGHRAAHEERPMGKRRGVAGGRPPLLPVHGHADGQGLPSQPRGVE
jgi:transposase